MAAELARLRARLLDLTTRNRLLSFGHPRASCLRFVQADLDSVFDALLAGKALRFEPVPKPSAREVAAYWASQGQPEKTDPPDAERWARYQGIDVDYDLAPMSGTDGGRGARQRLQTVLYPEQLEARVRKLRSDARTAIEESGANMLYLAFGFLEWREPGDPSRVCPAPLLLVPVTIDRPRTRAGRHEYELSWTGEDLQPNLSLVRKLEQDFGIVLPSLFSDEKEERPSPPTHYLREVANAVRSETGWRVRHYLTLALFNFGKLLLYLDLDPKRWPAGQNLETRPLLRHLVGGEGGAPPPNSESGADEIARKIDLDLPLVDRADGSQSEALLRALGGETMLIEGPPGTGKSQTITNLIASELGSGKTVLFVADKLAALEVVRRRLAALGLGDFCLELHSHKTRKRALLDDLDGTLKRRDGRTSARALGDKLVQLQKYRERLARYCALIAQPCGRVGETVEYALYHAGRLQVVLGEACRTLTPPAPDGATAVSASERDGALRILSQLAAAVRKIAPAGPILRHPWRGVSSAQLFDHDADRTIEALERWRLAAAELREAAATLPGPFHDYVGDHFRRLAMLVSAAENLRLLDRLRPVVAAAGAAVEEARQMLGLDEPVSIESIRMVLAVVDLATLAPRDALGLRHERLLDTTADTVIELFEAKLTRLHELHAPLAGTFPLSRLDHLQADDCRHDARLLRSAGFFARFGSEFRAARRRYHMLAEPGPRHPPPVMADHLERLADVVDAHRDVSSQLDARDLFGLAFQGVETDLAPFKRLRAWVREVESRLVGIGRLEVRNRLLRSTLSDLQVLAELGALRHIRPFLEQGAAGAQSAGLASDAGSLLWRQICLSILPGKLGTMVSGLADSGDLGACLASLEKLAALFEAEQKARDHFVDLTGIDPQAWLGAAQDAVQLGEIVTRAEYALAAAAELPAWLDYDRVRRQAEGPLVRQVRDAVEAGQIGPDVLRDAYDWLLFEGLARAAFKAAPELQGLAGTSLDGLRNAFRELDEEVMELRRTEIAHHLSRRHLPADQLQVIRREIAKQRRHIPIRRLVERAHSALVGLKPCFMMGPLSVAQYLPPGSLAFDLVIMDEASQMRPEDSIGALARAGQAIIVGDRKQLPPTAFFDRLEDDGDDEGEEDALAGSAQSIMDIAAVNVARPALLRWHYRSRDPRLIAFSNHEFYGNELIVPPIPIQDGSRYGITFEFVGGTTADSMNVLEARRAADFIARHLSLEPSRSLGIVAMNLKQSLLIQEELDRRLRDDPVAAERYEESQGRVEPVFIKNLENVQGDERDVILISMTYGPGEPGGRVAQRFGPINREDGWRRLNVLVTRARQRLVVLSSMRAGDIVAETSAKRGVRALRSFLDYAEHGRLGGEPVIGGREPDSDFEIAVARTLRDVGYACVAQLGVQGFFIDIAVRDPDRPGAFLLAVECDGASYHGTKSARDRDRIRQDILEDLGWEVERVWSTDWFRDPGRIVDRLVKRLDEVREARRAREVASVSATAGAAGPAPAAGEPPPSAADAEQPARPVPTSPILTEEDLRKALIELRETEVEPAFPDADPARGLLRKAMIDALVRHRPADRQEFLARIPKELRERTDGEQYKRYADRVFGLLSETG